MKPEDALREAHKELGGLERVKESVRDIRAGAFTDTLNRLGAPRVALLSYSLWRARFGGDPSVIGRGFTE